MRARLSVSTFVTDKLAAILIHRYIRGCYGCAEIRSRVVDGWNACLWYSVGWSAGGERVETNRRAE